MGPAANLGGGGGLNIFFRGRNVHQVQVHGLFLAQCVNMPAPRSLSFNPSRFP